MVTFPIWPPPSGQEPAASTPEWIFEDPRSRAPLDEVEQVASGDATMLISSETGASRELVACYLHNHGTRQGGPSMAMSCGAFSDTLVDTELFSHENDAFADAFDTQVGWSEQANSGTIFLDEVNGLPLSVQNRLLHVLQEHEIVRLDGCTPIPVGLRIVAATTIDPGTLVRKKHSHKDLYYQLNVVNLNVLVLKERPGDIIPLARYFVSTYSKRFGHTRVTLIPAAERLLMQSPWHGNVRELENITHRTFLLYDGNTIDAPELRLSSCSTRAQAQTETDPPIACATASVTQPSVPYNTNEADLLCQTVQHLYNDSVGNVYQLVEDTLFREVFRYCHYSQSNAARVLGVSRNVMRARLIRLGEIDTPRMSSFAAKLGIPAYGDVMGT